MYLLDTNTCIYLKNKKPIYVLEKLKSVIHERLFISSVTVGELQYGVYESTNIERNRISLTEFLAPFEILNFDDSDAEVFGKIRSALKKSGQIIGPYDMLIGAQAISKNLILVTNNTKEFNRIPGIILEDWR